MQTKALLPYLFCFWHVARYRSFTQASKELNISQSSVSYQVRKLEDLLGEQLIDRDKGTDVKLHQAGEKLASQCSTIFLGLEQTIGAIQGRSVSGRIVVAGPSCFGSLILTRVVARLQTTAPELEVRLRLSDDHINLREQQIDLAFRTMTQRRDVDTMPLLKTGMRFVASRTYLERHGHPTGLDELREHPIILSNPEDADWRALLEQRPAISDVPFSFIYIDNVWAVLNALHADVGVSYLPEYAIFRGLQDGSLVELLTEELGSPHLTMCLSSPQKVGNDPRIQAFLSALHDIMAVSPYVGRFKQVGPHWDQIIENMDK